VNIVGLYRWFRCIKRKITWCNHSVFRSSSYEIMHPCKLISRDRQIFQM